MTDSMSHRGPDDSGFFTDGNIALGHRRLSIIDTSASGRQPLSIKDRFWICFNGEIYNYKEIKQTLKQKGLRFNTETDTEVALMAFIHYGISFLQHLNGMFAMCIYDQITNQKYLIRDRMGIKPLYYSFTHSQLVFASELKAILTHPSIKTRANQKAMSSYLSYRYPLGDQSFFEGINSLEPGHYIQIDDSGNSSKHQYWELPLNEKVDLGEDYYLTKTEELLQSATNYRMISDVKIGAYLSGGVDSSGLVALMKNNFEEQIKTFTIGFEEKGYNEFEYSRIVADLYNTDHTEILYSGLEYFDDMRKLISFKDAPLGVPNEPALFKMSKELKKHFTVVLSGEGADEIFGGYGRIFQSAIDFDKLQSKNKSRELVKNLELKYGINSPDSVVGHFFLLYQYMSNEEKILFMSEEFNQQAADHNYADKLLIDAFSKVSHLSTVDQFMWVFEKHHLPGLLQRVDTTTMAASVEARVPFVDHRLVEFALSMPSAYKLKWKSILDERKAAQLNATQISEVHDIPKYILKKQLESSLPNEILYRKKMGFPIPLQKWFGGNFKEICLDTLTSQRAINRNLYNREFVENVFKGDQLINDHGLGHKLWMLLNIEMWHEQYID